MSRRKKGLSPEDRMLWERVKATAKPLQNPARTTEDAPPPPSQKPVTTPSGGSKTFRVGELAAKRASGLQLAPSVVERVNDAPVRMHQATHKKMVKGKLTPESRIDLHGMTLSRAHPALTRFILDAHHAGKRLVLVITGKGRDRVDVGPIPIRRGVLRHQVPAWLAAPPLGQIVLDIRTAHVRHGGEGAYYVYLKRAR
ncbi:MAG: Smr/MutS family protein [Pseudomonadota bacterium]